MSAKMTLAVGRRPSNAKTPTSQNGYNQSFPSNANISTTSQDMELPVESLPPLNSQKGGTVTSSRDMVNL